MREVTFGEFLLFAKDLIRYWVGKWPVFLSVLIICGVIFSAGSFIKSPVFVASVRFIKEYPSLTVNNKVFGISSNRKLAVTSLFDDDNLGAVFKSKDLIEASLLEPVEWLGKNKILLDGYWQGEWKNASIPGAQITAANGRDSLERALRITSKKIVDEKMIAFSEDKSSSYYTLTVCHADEQFARTFCVQIIKAAVNFHDQLRRHKAVSNLGMIQRELDSVRRVLSYSIAASASTADLGVNAVRQIVKAGADEVEIEREANSTLYDELTKQMEIARINSIVAGPVIKIIDTPYLPLRKEKINFFEIFNVVIFILLVISVLTFITRWDNTNVFREND